MTACAWHVQSLIGQPVVRSVWAGIILVTCWRNTCDVLVTKQIAVIDSVGAKYLAFVCKFGTVLVIT